MTSLEFQGQMQRLIQVYGERHYPAERVELIWEKVKFRNQSVFAEAISNLIADCSQPPLLNKIIEAVFLAQKQFPQVTSDPYASTRKQIHDASLEEEVCAKCENYGTVWAYRLDVKGFPQTTFRCDCKSGGFAKVLPENKDLALWPPKNHELFILHAEWIRSWRDSDKLEPFRHIHTLPKEERMNGIVQILKNKGLEKVLD